MNPSAPDREQPAAAPSRPWRDPRRLALLAGLLAALVLVAGGAVVVLRPRGGRPRDAGPRPAGGSGRWRHRPTRSAT